MVIIAEFETFSEKNRQNLTFHFTRIVNLLPNTGQRIFRQHSHPALVVNGVDFGLGRAVTPMVVAELVANVKRVGFIRATRRACFTKV